MIEISVTVVYAWPDAATEIAVRLPAGATIAEAIARSGICARLGLAAVAKLRVGVFGKRARHDTTLVDGDRVEIYRPLKEDAQQARHRRITNKRR